MTVESLRKCLKTCDPTSEVYFATEIEEVKGGRHDGAKNIKMECIDYLAGMDNGEVMIVVLCRNPD